MVIPDASPPWGRSETRPPTGPGRLSLDRRAVGSRGRHEAGAPPRVEQRDIAAGDGRMRQQPHVGERVVQPRAPERAQHRDPGRAAADGFQQRELRVRLVLVDRGPDHLDPRRPCGLDVGRRQRIEVADEHLGRHPERPGPHEPAVRGDDRGDAGRPPGPGTIERRPPRHVAIGDHEDVAIGEVRKRHVPGGRHRPDATGPSAGNGPGGVLYPRRRAGPAAAALVDPARGRRRGAQGRRPRGAHLRGVDAHGRGGRGGRRGGARADRQVARVRGAGRRRDARADPVPGLGSQSRRPRAARGGDRRA